MGKDVHWFSTGFRYLHYLTSHFNLALEVGSDYIDSSTHVNKRHPRGWLTKFTFSPQISWDYGYTLHIL
ncbi:carbohydrate porin [Bacteroidetes bacterium endosymbiont of Geopemphigus sp.]|uniref:carbohydrate porin n=1 Tax=Bacteroidetes bacterium endosymbiont of Geopemphigus sp. TaxID=2047937 RepID=UPI0011AFC6B1